MVAPLSDLSVFQQSLLAISRIANGWLDFVRGAMSQCECSAHESPDRDMATSSGHVAPCVDPFSPRLAILFT